MEKNTTTTKTNKQTEGKKRKERKTDKQTSIEIKLELSQWRPAVSPSSFPIFLKNSSLHYYKLPNVSKYGRLRMLNLFSKVHRDLNFIIDWLICGTTVYGEIVTQIAMNEPETDLLNALLCHDVSLPIRTLQRWDTAREPKVASHQPTFVLTNTVLTGEKKLCKELLWTAHTHKNRFLLADIRTNRHQTSRRL